jgi:Myb-like DNA-binding domain
MGIKFTPAEDAQVIHLKEQVGGSWKAIQEAFAGIFPGTTRKFNDLQVRYTRSLQPGKKFRAPALAYGANGMFKNLHTCLRTDSSLVFKIFALCN